MPQKRTQEELADELYYHGFLPRHDVEQMLKDEGDFLVRTVEMDESGTKRHVVSVMCEGRHKHILIKRTKTKGTFYVKLYEFDDIPKLIRFYHERKMVLNQKSGAKLLKAVPRQEWELLHEQIKLKKKIGEGAYGAVHTAALRVSRVQTLSVAVKLHHIDPQQPAAKAQLDEIMREARLLRNFEHPNIVRFYGVAAKEQPLMIVMELVRGGGLDKFVKTFAKRLTNTDRISFSLDAARGLQYLHSKNCLHRDIAARNCLIDRNYFVKISDFGLSREVQGSFQQLDGTKVPVRWIAPEVFKNMMYNQKTDVYSYSVLLYEIFTDGGFPYSGKTAAEVKKFVQRGGRLELPESTPESIRTLVAECWHEDPGRRPEFANVVKQLEEVIASALGDDTKNKRKTITYTMTKLGGLLRIGSGESAGTGEAKASGEIVTGASAEATTQDKIDEPPRPSQQSKSKRRPKKDKKENDTLRGKK